MTYFKTINIKKQVARYLQDLCWIGRILLVLIRRLTTQNRCRYNKYTNFHISSNGTYQEVGIKNFASYPQANSK